MAYDASGEERFTRQEEPREGGTTRRGVPVHDRNRSWYWLFAIPFVFTLLPWIYNTNDPSCSGYRSSTGTRWPGCRSRSSLRSSST